MATRERCDAGLARGPVWLACALAVLLLQAVLIANHSPWPDEYQAVMLAVQAPDIHALFGWLRYEGHPPLWYLLLRALATVADPLDTLWLAALLIALPTQALILFASPFRRSERLMIALSEFMLFDFLTISRSQTLGVALMVLVMVLWRRRWVWLAIALLPMCDFLFGVVSGIFVLLQWREKGLWWPGVTLWLLLSALAGWSVVPAPDMVSAFDQFGMQSGLLVWLSEMSSLAIPFQGGIAPQWNSPTNPVAGFAWLAFILLAWWQTRHDGFHRFLLFGFIALTLAFSLLVYPLGLRHLMLIALLLILFEWRVRCDGGKPNIPFTSWLAVCAICGLATAAVSFTRPFHAAGQVVAEIRARGLDDAHWMAFPDWRVPSVSALSGMQFERAEQECMMDFVRWDHRTSLLEPGRLEAYLTARVERDGRFYLLSDLPLAFLPPALARPLAEIEAGYDGIPFYLFEVGPDAEKRDITRPACVPEKRPLHPAAGK